MGTDWEKQYQIGETPWDKGLPSPGLVDFLKQRPVTSGVKVLVPGCGTGSDVVEWSRCGAAATGFDIAESAVALGRKKAARNEVGASFECGNFLQDEVSQEFDWIFEHTLFCAIDPELRDRYVESVDRWLSPEGRYLSVFYLIPDKDGPPFGVDRTEIFRRFSGTFEPLEEWVPRSYPNRQGLELMVLWRKR